MRGQLLGRNEDGLLPSSSSPSRRPLLAAVSPSCSTTESSAAVLSSTAGYKSKIQGRCIQCWIFIPMHYHLLYKDIPNQGNESDCGIFVLNFLEYLWAGKPFDFEAKDGAALRVKTATGIFKISKQVSCNNIVEEGHHANRCPKVKNKIRTLNISDEIKDKLIHLLYNDLSSDAFESYSDNEPSDSSDNIVLAINHTSSTDTSTQPCLSDNYPDKQHCVCKEINVLDQHGYSMIISMIDSIEDSSLKAKYIQELQQKISKGKSQQSVVPPPSHTTSIPFSTLDFDSNVIGRFQTKDRKVSISDLQKEIQNLKYEIKIIKINISNLQHSSSTPKTTHQLLVPPKQPNFASSSDSDDPGSQHNTKQPALTTILNPARIPCQLCQIKTYKIHKWYIEIDIRISQDYNLIVNALVDTGADLNCIREALVPTKYLEKTTESLFGANRQQLEIQYKLANAKVCNQGICYTTDFVMVKTLSQNVILDLPFLQLISPFKVTSDGLITEYLNKEILFLFIYPLIICDLDTLKKECIHCTPSPTLFMDQCIANLNIKQTQLSYLKDDLVFEKQKARLSDPHMLEQIKQF
ncbi:hypothetical protein Dsin_023672 [Dipteronia sinensis]|uniref:Peptidase A2 domain-containing protein n=1 Tax=Dipteronia sinensis TaxID=43782 RepID=A0AAE0A4R3_9ROSI|nr:hypothetical protein Dsin_023672 [Dipteronia sinensis]